MTTVKLERGYKNITLKIKLKFILIFICGSLLILIPVFMYSKNYVLEPLQNSTVSFEAVKVQAETLEDSAAEGRGPVRQRFKIVDSEKIINLNIKNNTNYEGAIHLWSYPETKDLEPFNTTFVVEKIDDDFYSIEKFEVRTESSTGWQSLFIFIFLIGAAVLQVTLNVFAGASLGNSRVKGFEVAYLKNMAYSYPDANAFVKNRLEKKPVFLIIVLSILTNFYCSYFFILNMDALEGKATTLFSYFAMLAGTVVLTILTFITVNSSDFSLVSNIINKITWGKNLKRIQAENISFEDETFLKEFSVKLASDKIDAEVIKILAPVFTGSLQDLKENAKVLSQDET